MRDNIRKYWIFYLTGILYILLITVPLDNFAFVPDFLNLSKLDSQNYFGMILGAIASIFGVLMAVIILSVEFFKERLSRNSYVNPLERSAIQNTIHLSINIILLAFISYISIDKFDNSKDITLGYFVAFLFIVYICSVYPFLKNIIDNSSQIKNVLERANSLTIEDFKEVSRYRYQKKNPDAKFLILKKDIDSYILENKVSSYETIINTILNKGLELIEKGEDRQICEEVYGAIAWLMGENGKTSIINNDSQYFDLVWNSINKIYISAADKQMDLLHLQEIDMFINFDLKNLYKQFKNTLSLNNALNVIENCFNENITKNCPKQEDIWDLMNLYEKVGAEHPSYGNSSLSWDYLHKILGYVGDLQEIAIELNDRDLFTECNNRSITICEHILFSFNNLGNYQKGYLIWHCLSTSYYNSSVALEKGLFPNTMYCFDVPKNLIERIIQEKLLEEKDIRILIKPLGEYFFKALKNKNLDLGYYIGPFGDFCKIGVCCLKTYKTNILSKHTVKYFIKYFKYLKNYIETQGIEIYPQEYKLVKRAFKHYIDVAIKSDGFKENENPLKKWSELYSSFNNVDNDDNEFGIVGWKIKSDQNLMKN